jgi:NAD(P)-dependent dehydrogenase (short-subunit alcohol dehydrogenase family)
MAGHGPEYIWDSTNIPNLKGKVIIVTGGNTGIGLQAAMAFAGKGAETILACRNEIKARRAVILIQSSFPGSCVKYLHLDLANLESVHRFAESFSNSFGRLDILLNNAGVILNPYRTTDDGFESQMGINHLGHFALTGLLMDIIAKTDGSRVVNVSSKIHRFGRMDFEDLQYSSGIGYSRIGAYSRSKLANLLFTYELDRRFQMANINAQAMAVHPGYAYTDFGRARFFRVLKYMFYPLVLVITQSAEQGALPSLRASVDPVVKGGDFLGPGGRFQIRGSPVNISSIGASHNRADATILWEISEKLTGVRFLQAPGI